jgi:hypothetical protein
LWFRFTDDGKRKVFMSASTLGDIMVTPPVEWEAFAKEWVALEGERDGVVDEEVDDLAVAMGNWGKNDSDDAMMD